MQLNVSTSEYDESNAMKAIMENIVFSVNKDRQEFAQI